MHHPTAVTLLIRAMFPDGDKVEFDGAAGIMNNVGHIAIEGKEFERPAAWVEHVCRSRGMYGNGEVG